ncbi:hypothetical protein [uncultured Eubacterium sp.]|jgi:gas vesicle protein|uniref:hypothetical protein n=1 Tax=uncultured Eubacterium sp. TaxID=165185 RepID=UPI00261194AE|nr:hypothetical protein [uncultured Eubacterium sp.]
MNWDTILASGVIAALITGILSFISALMKSNKEGKLSRITDERKMWRDEIRQIAQEISIIDVNDLDNPKSKNRFSELLTKLKVRINSRGFDKENILQDSHIWKSIINLEEKDTCTKLEIDKLIHYLSALLKYDWERSKMEISVNISQIVGYGIYAVSNGILVYQSYKNFQNTKIQDVIFLLLLFLLMFFSPEILSFTYKICNFKWDWANLFIPYVSALIVYIGMIFSINKIKDGTEVFVLPIILQLISLIFIIISQYRNHKNDSDYIKEVEQINDQYEKLDKSKTLKK